MPRTVSLRVPRTTFLILVALLTAGLVAILGTGATTSPGAVFVKDPYMGVSCRTPSSTACGRVGLAVWLARRATVTATIDGASFTVDDPTRSLHPRQGSRPLYTYAGFLQPAGMTTRDSLVRFR